jgi:hypothetical protein
MGLEKGLSYVSLDNLSVHRQADLNTFDAGRTLLHAEKTSRNMVPSDMYTKFDNMRTTALKNTQNVFWFYSHHAHFFFKFQSHVLNNSRILRYAVVK